MAGGADNDDNSKIAKHATKATIGLSTGIASLFAGQAGGKFFGDTLGGVANEIGSAVTGEESWLPGWK